jgi:predicted site-specific integrase-resolvase
MNNKQPHGEHGLSKASDVANYFGVTPDTIRKWARLGYIPHYALPSGHFLYDIAEIKKSLKKP